MKKSILLLVAAAFLLVAVAVAGMFLFTPVWQAPFPPNPNGYDDFVEAGRVLTGEPPMSSEGAPDDWRKYALANRESLAMVRRGLGRTSLVPLHPDQDFLTAQMDVLVTFKRLARLLEAESRVTESEGRINDALTNCFEIVQFGRASAHGGLLIHSLVELSIERLALHRIDALLPELDAVQCRELAKTLERLDRTRDPTGAVIARERDFMRAMTGAKYHLLRILTKSQLRKAEAVFAAKMDGQALLTRTLALKAAARAYELDRQEQPPGVSVLIPFYLQTAPVDPVTGQPIQLPSE